jgi:hypothetical protein
MIIELVFSVATLTESWEVLYGDATSGVTLLFTNYCAILVITAVEDIDLNLYFEQNPALALCFCIIEMLDWCDTPIAVLVGEFRRNKEWWPHICWIGALPYVYTFSRFKQVLSQQKGFPRMTEIWAMTWVLVFVVDGLSMLAVMAENPSGGLAQYHFGAVMVATTGAKVFLASIAFMASCITAFAYTKSRRLGQSFTVSLYMCIFASTICKGFYQSSILILSRQPSEVLRMDRKWIIGPALFVAVMPVIYALFNHHQKEAKGKRRRERIVRVCLPARPPRPFHKTEFLKLWMRWAAEGKETVLVELLFQAVEWCMDEPCTYWKVRNVLVCVLHTRSCSLTHILFVHSIWSRISGNSRSGTTRSTSAGFRSWRGIGRLCSSGR